MSEEEVLRMIAKLRDDVTSPLSRVEKSMRGFGKRGNETSKHLTEGFRSVHEQLRKVTDVAKAGVAPAIDAVGISSLSAVGAVAALTAGLRNFVDQGTDVAAFGRKVQLTTSTIRGLEGVADKFEVDPNTIRQGLQTFTDAMYDVRHHVGDLYNHLKGQRFTDSQILAGLPQSVEGNEKALKDFFEILEDVKKRWGEATARRFSKEAFGNDAFVDLLRNGNAGLAEAVKQTLALRGAMDTDAAESWVRNWSDFKATIEGVRNEIGNDLLPDLTALAKEGEQFFAENKAEIGREITGTLREMGDAMRDVNSGVQAIGGWKIVFEGLIALKLLGLAGNIGKVAKAMGMLVGLGSPPGWVLAMLGITGLAATLDQQSGLPGAAGAYDPMLSGSNLDMLGGLHLGRQRFAARLNRSHLPASAAAIIKGLRDRGLDAEHAAIMGGNIEQESDFDPTKPNYAEGGIGLIQWRLERREALQHLARLRHKAETDAATQLDYLMMELKDTPDGRAFLAARSPADMNSALHGFIRYGDASEGQRLAYGQALMPMAQKVTGSASIDVNVSAPKGTSVKADADGLFDTVQVNRGLAMDGGSAW
jgi:hypothetical protein